MRRRNWISAVIATIGLTAAFAAPASAATPDVLLSDDGVNFSTGLSNGLFDGLGLLVPGESMASTLWIKNPTTDSSVTRVSIGSLSVPSAAFASGVTLTTVDVGAATTATASLADLQRCAVLVPSHSLAPGGILRVDFTVTMLQSISGVDAQGEAATLDFQVAMRDAAAGAFPSAGCVIPSTPLPPSIPPTEPTAPTTPTIPGAPTAPAGRISSQGSGLAYTGLAPATFLFPIAGALIGVGIFFVVRRRRREAGDS